MKAETKTDREVMSEITEKAEVSNDMKSLEGQGDFSLNLACFL